MRYWVLSVILLLTVLQSQSVVLASDLPAHTLVLVTNSNLPIKKFPPNELRKLFLGFPIIVNETPLIPLRNYSDDLLKETFLQKVMYMSERHYERQLLLQAFRTGNSRPPIYTNHDDLIQALKRKPGSISVIWFKDVGGNNALRVIQVFKGRVH